MVRPQLESRAVGPRRLYVFSARPEPRRMGTRNSVDFHNWGQRQATPMVPPPPPNSNVIESAEERVARKMDALDRVLEKRGEMIHEILENVKRRNMIRARLRLALLGVSTLGDAIYIKKHFFSGSQDQAGGTNPPPSHSHHQLDN
ncbi:hypothetical protein PVAP13_9KG280026 [Panicum virgatum]|uniref:Uncharacterized protein n=1 Tax=Panicum virgatum TaxID=38727 RepID=A0A8T0NKN7_PANVG|nr:hypothetical protein PVAP13_9KG280026 [Panicum virgatum]